MPLFPRLQSLIGCQLDAESLLGELANIVLLVLSRGDGNKGSHFLYLHLLQAAVGKVAVCFGISRLVGDMT